MNQEQRDAFNKVGDEVGISGLAEMVEREGLDAKCRLDGRGVWRKSLSVGRKNLTGIKALDAVNDMVITGETDGPGAFDIGAMLGALASGRGTVSTQVSTQVKSKTASGKVWYSWMGQKAKQDLNDKLTEDQQIMLTGLSKELGIDLFELVAQALTAPQGDKE